jgi:DNA polymerase-4
MSTTLPAYSNLSDPANDVHVAAGLQPGAFSSPSVETLRPAFRIAAPHIAYIRFNRFPASPELSRHPRPHDEPLRTILASYTPAVDPDGHHGFYLNFFGSPDLAHDFPGTLRRLQLEIHKRTGLNASIGAASTRVGAAVASRLERPGGIRVLTSGTEASFFAPLPIEALHRIGPIDAADLRRRGIFSIGELRRVPLPALQSAYGDSIARQVWHHSRGMDTPPALPVRWSVAAVLNFLASLLEDKSPCVASSV